MSYPPPHFLHKLSVICWLVSESYHTNHGLSVIDLFSVAAAVFSYNAWCLFPAFRQISFPIPVTRKSFGTPMVEKYLGEVIRQEKYVWPASNLFFFLYEDLIHTIGLGVSVCL